MSNRETIYEGGNCLFAKYSFGVSNGIDADGATLRCEVKGATMRVNITHPEDMRALAQQLLEGADELEKAQSK